MGGARQGHREPICRQRGIRMTPLVCLWAAAGDRGDGDVVDLYGLSSRRWKRRPSASMLPRSSGSTVRSSCCEALQQPCACQRPQLAAQRLRGCDQQVSELAAARLALERDHARDRARPATSPPIAPCKANARGASSNAEPTTRQGRALRTTSSETRFAAAPCSRSPARR